MDTPIGKRRLSTAGGSSNRSCGQPELVRLALPGGHQPAGCPWRPRATRLIHMISSPIPRLAVGTLRRHKGVYVGTFVAAVLAIALLAAGGTLLFSVLTAKPTANRFAAADVVV